ncbi:hypothetical protein CORC01_03057 [Colletotrichum orchidophilum]|uniref:Uncharacterized protein n=1 Tax=Colletotrichum orchidophilum TaxID=1209926 RepID=A0A1G4BJV4_9PEZI|nr:uncharacterized protein CORC01_03057 [Colletotrichum orchidophilum]OHF01567.1 hypothetical protein CORC01_03057 [Colletotrichum orchidophilum]
MSQSQLPTVKPLIDGHATSAIGGFQLYQNAACKDLKVLDDKNEGMAFKNALRLVSPNLEKKAIDNAIAQLFLTADILSSQRSYVTESVPSLLLLAARETPWGRKRPRQSFRRLMGRR